jgi:hypothetical protein
MTSKEVKASVDHIFTEAFMSLLRPICLHVASLYVSKT